ncbi:hypothetical protein [Chenggangzhangella methanolivorans]|uniref:Uncharacterized protein n=1 Tax=Chenggangzhangella methanolivorans TaxID=1437009 RepID=A0A9E6ULQ0_9HYPH|nr:hypothetical protein [Chenggangzhangella methanolivorans]QZO00797.1 hypothetical protein K6K41_03765 [Chenggangzhangella methanolivorans]
MDRAPRQIERRGQPRAAARGDRRGADAGRSGRAEDLRQCLRLCGLAIPLFAIALHVYDPATLGVIDGFEQTAFNAALALTLLLVAMGFDRPAASLRWQVANIGVVVLAPLVALTVHFASAEREAALAAASERLAALGRLGGERQDAVVAQTRQMLTFLAAPSRSDSRGPSAIGNSPPICRSSPASAPSTPSTGRASSAARTIRRACRSTSATATMCARPSQAAVSRSRASSSRASAARRAWRSRCR